VIANLHHSIQLRTW